MKYAHMTQNEHPTRYRHVFFPVPTFSFSIFMKFLILAEEVYRLVALRARICGGSRGTSFFVSARPLCIDRLPEGAARRRATSFPAEPYNVLLSRHFFSFRRDRFFCIDRLPEDARPAPQDFSLIFKPLFVKMLNLEQRKSVY